MIVRSALPCVMVAAAAVTSLTAGSPWKQVEVPFAFHVGDGEFASGAYQILAWTADGGTVLKMKGPAGEFEIQVLTRLARTTATATATNLVFDTVDGKRWLSEVWLSGEDGYLVRGNLGEKPHEHMILKGEGSN